MEDNNIEIKNFYDKYIVEINKNFYEEFRWFQSRYHSVQYWDTLSYIFKINQKLDLINNKKIIEIGGGAGTWTRVLLKLGAKSIVDVDISKAMISQAQLNLGVREKLKYVEKDFTKITTEVGIVNSIFAFRCFEYFDKKDAFFKVAASKLNPSGTLVIVTKKKPLRRQGRSIHNRQVTLQQIKIMAENEGLSLIEKRVVSYDIRLPKFGKLYVLSTICLKFFPSGNAFLNLFVESWGFVFKHENSAH